MQQIGVDEFKQKFMSNPENLEIIDVRQPEEFAQIKIKGSKLIPMQDIGRHLDSIDWNKEVIWVCRTGSRSGYVTQALAQHGYEGKNLAGGIYLLNMNCEECIQRGDLDQSYFN